MESRDFYTPRKRRPARARALPDAGVAVSACRLAVWSFTLLIYYYISSLIINSYKPLLINLL